MWSCSKGVNFALGFGKLSGSALAVPVMPPFLWLLIPYLLPRAQFSRSSPLGGSITKHSCSCHSPARKLGEGFWGYSGLYWVLLCLWPAHSLLP